MEEERGWGREEDGVDDIKKSEREIRLDLPLQYFMHIDHYSKSAKMRSMTR